MEETKPKPFVFVLMPFSEELNDTYEVGIKPACKDAGAFCERVDEQIFVDSILERVYNQIAKADVIIAEMTGRNPNVFYETGYAHALNKRVILLTRNSDDIPFDLKHYPHIVYEGKIATLKTQLEARIKWCIENPRKSLSSNDINLDFSISRNSLDNNPRIGPYYLTKNVDRMDNGDFGHKVRIKLDIHNSTNFTIYGKSFTLALILPEIFEISGKGYSFSRLPNKRNIWKLHPVSDLFPDSWNAIDLDLLIPKNQIVQEEVEIILRLFSVLGPRDYPFVLLISKDT